MKKTITTVCILLVAVLLAGCNFNEAEKLESESPQNQIAEQENEIIPLTIDNYQKYISVHAQGFLDSTSHSYFCYNFIGSSLCKFNDVTITYSYGDSSKLCTLNLSGYGQTSPTRFSKYPPSLSIVSVTGTVEILY